MTNPASPRLPEAVEQAIEQYERESVFGSAVRRRRADALRAAILAYGAARERQGIERAAAVCDSRAEDWDKNTEGWADPIRCAEAESCRNALRALPVDGATP